MSDQAPQQSTPPPTAVIPVRWIVPESVTPRYATNFTLQRTEHEYILSFFQIVPPLIVGGPEQVAEQIQGIHEIQAKCLFQVIIAEDRLPELQGVLANGAILPATQISGEVKIMSAESKE